MSRTARTAVLSLLLALSLPFGACASEDTASEITGFEDVQFYGNTNVAALKTVLAATPVGGDPGRARIYQPAQGINAPLAPPMEVKWHAGAVATLEAPPGSTESSAMGPAAHPTPVLSHLSDLMGISVAHASEPPVSGVVHFLVFSTLVKKDVVRVFTDQDSYLPDEATWQKLADTREQIFIDILSAKLENGAVAPDGGPFLGERSTFSIYH